MDGALVTTVWVSAALFGLYILAFYVAALYGHDMQRWNNVLPGLYTRTSTASTAGIGLHFAGGGIVLVLGSIQLIASVRNRFPAVHRWIGRVYVVASLLTGVGGLLFISLIRNDRGARNEPGLRALRHPDSCSRV
jgi:hypothetical protein